MASPIQYKFVLRGFYKPKDPSRAIRSKFSVRRTSGNSSINFLSHFCQVLFLVCSSVCKHTCICVCMFLCVQVHMCVCICMHAPVCAGACVCVYAGAHVYVGVCRCTHVCSRTCGGQMTNSGTIPQSPTT